VGHFRVSKSADRLGVVTIPDVAAVQGGLPVMLDGKAQIMGGQDADRRDEESGPRPAAILRPDLPAIRDLIEGR